jgi:pimeloyl-ACP methyl ester carboxylesterase
MDYPTMAADVAETMDHLGLSRAAVVGHSMGGKVAMALALAEPLRVTTLVVADTAPAAHSGNHHALVQAMLAVDLRSAARRADVDAALASRVPDGVVRAFLLQGVVTGPDGGLTWRNNLRVLDRSMATISGFPVFPANATYLGPVLFVAGGRSTYLRPEHRAVIGGLFPAATYVTLEGAGHWVHADRPEVFSRLVREHVLGERG